MAAGVNNEKKLSDNEKMELLKDYKTLSLQLWNQNEKSPKKTDKTNAAKDLAPVVPRLDNSIRRINHYPADSVVCFVNIYPLDSDLSGGQRYPAFEQLGPG